MLRLIKFDSDGIFTLLTILSKLEFAALLDPFYLQGKVAIAVSGGGDSLALALLMKKLADETPNPMNLVTLTVDHQLRPESTAEAGQVHQWMDSHGLEHHVLTWHHPPLTHDIQNKARDARYQLLSDWCLAHKVETLMTAHHLHDQWETIMMRLSKGSGLTGLCGIRAMVKTSFGQLVRPLLTIPPDRLTLTLQTFKQPFLDDPSNKNTRFERVRWRQLLTILSDAGLTPDKVQKTLIQLQAAEDFCEQQTDQALKVCFKDDQGLKLDCFKTLPVEIACRVLKRVILNIGKAPYPLSHSVVQRLYQKLIAPTFKGATAGGCYLKRTQGGWIKIEKESPRRSRNI
ncbi:tRNA lysidine(34) synthetase TilS [Candidatus Finniella inopinata]|uniref:tRNA(Ile)-lysidine synthase n=1 Tax=Candidatus Finniella inopinata TaxID=1696036 RepID=A0A4Q7DGB9_9PROT|nr:tRNA lysidine(34) synthetase TilS [Candidatus Finniella inopinata]RZI45901.1 tRNA lysidine(34) synthetase TilS [Candidatus Finniella inopinata]